MLRDTGMIRSIWMCIGMLVAGCSGSQPSPETPDKAADEGGDSKGKAEIRIREGGQGMAKYDMLVKGRSVWPPQGAGCDRLVHCCNELSAAGDNMILACLVATAGSPDCGKARENAVAMAREQSQPVPQACND
jgi:hypothetical protein